MTFVDYLDEFVRHYMGGDCLNTGCVPSKALIAAAKNAAAAPPKDANANFQAVRSTPKISTKTWP